MNENNTPNQPRPTRGRPIQFGPPPATDPSAAQPVVVHVGAKTKTKTKTKKKPSKPITGPKLVGDEPVQ
jgi:hypothetical protein